MTDGFWQASDFSDMGGSHNDCFFMVSFSFRSCHAPDYTARPTGGYVPGEHNLSPAAWRRFGSFDMNYRAFQNPKFKGRNPNWIGGRLGMGRGKTTRRRERQGATLRVRMKGATRRGERSGEIRAFAPNPNYRDFNRTPFRHAG
jgi:hypothetical protein